MKIVVIGYSGAGKSTLAKQLGGLYNCPVLHLDKIQFEPGWKEREVQQAQAMVLEFMVYPHWVIDGNYAGLYQKRRLDDADLIVFFNFPRVVCLWQAYCRFMKYRSKSRDDMASGCIEKLDFTFIKWILLDGRTAARRKHYKQITEAYPHKTIVLRNWEQANIFLQRQASGHPAI